MAKIKVPAGEVVTNVAGLVATSRDYQELRREADVLAETRKAAERLILSGTFKRVELIDSLVPDSTGLYCIRLARGSTLPAKYQNELKRRHSRLLYIGKAESRTLRQRFLDQELRGHGHGTFFRSVGTMLGFLPPPGCLRHCRRASNYKFGDGDSLEIARWIDSNLEASWITFAVPFVVERYLIEWYTPILNIKHNPSPYLLHVDARKACVAVAKGDAGAC